jgi:hypothetical protein
MYISRSISKTVSLLAGVGYAVAHKLAARQMAAGSGGKYKPVSENEVRYH